MSNTTTETTNSNNELEKLERNEFNQNLGLIVDSHCHLQEDTENIEHSLELPYEKMFLMGTTVEDWDRVNTLADRFNDKWKDTKTAYRSFGIHPWFVYKLQPPQELIGQPIDTLKPDGDKYQVDNSWYDKLRENLIRYPDAIVGEIGIDKVTKVKAIGKNDPHSQMIVLSKQIQLANEFNRVVSLHCVQLHGKLLDFFQALPLQQFPPRVALHTFGGKPSTVQQFSKMKDQKGDRFYFGLSFINLTSSKVSKLIESIPDDRLLLESDQNTPLEANESIFKVVKAISTTKKWTIKETLERTRLNALRFLAK
ncbi:hypothetical protein DLAC_03185 [Tieghemostelium lacteum]|uniref:Uncharacterized protein n=1 Tax=Tieghemostelium lacteum TaxID=361077 RepID=A0A152A2J5_TIELA|nr:hypothetical protein DLAC_03185 [Tieghemostelium lacteum]|eukprot:KYR00429.1 hypothetical protein DLAC_03185 [Tieghemostelium lacteum]